MGHHLLPCMRTGSHLKIGQYHQHPTDLLPSELTPLEYMMPKHKDINLEISGSMSYLHEP